MMRIAASLLIFAEAFAGPAAAKNPRDAQLIDFEWLTSRRFGFPAAHAPFAPVTVHITSKNLVTRCVD